MHTFRAAVEARDIEQVIGLLADDVVFHSPIVFAPTHGRAAVAPLLVAAARVFKDVCYETEIGSPEGADWAFVFTARVGDREVNGCDFVHVNDAGQIDALRVMVRPVSAALALVEAMRAELAPPA